MEIEQKYIRMQVLLTEIKEAIVNEIGHNPYEDLEKSIKIISQKNYNQFSLINKKVKNLSMILYNRNLDCNSYIFERIDEIYYIINDGGGKQ